MNNLLKKIFSFVLKYRIPNSQNKKIFMLLGFIIAYIFFLFIESNNTIWRFQPFKVKTIILGYALGLIFSEGCFTDSTLERYERMLPSLKILFKTIFLAILCEIAIKLVLILSGFDITPYVK